MGTYQDPSSDDGHTNPLHDAPSGATVQRQTDGHLKDDNAHTTPAAGRKARNYTDC